MFFGEKDLEALIQELDEAVAKIDFKKHRIENTFMQRYVGWRNQIHQQMERGNNRFATSAPIIRVALQLRSELLTALWGGVTK